MSATSNSIPKRGEVVKLNRREAYGTIVLSVLLIAVELFLTFSLVLTLSGDFIALVVGLFGGFIGTAIALFQFFFRLGWVYEAHHNANAIKKSKVLNWDPWATALFSIIPYINISVFVYAMYKIMEVSKVRKVGFYSLYAFVGFNIVSIVLHIIRSFLSQGDIFFSASDQGIFIHTLIGVTYIASTFVFLPVIYETYQAQKKFITNI